MPYWYDDAWVWDVLYTMWLLVLVPMLVVLVCALVAPFVDRDPDRRNPK